MVGARGSGTVVFLLFLTRAKRRKMTFFEGCPVGGVPTGAGLVDGGVDQGPGEGVREGLAWQGKGWSRASVSGGVGGTLSHRILL